MQTHGHLQLEIKQLVKSGQTPDLTRNGVARGYVVVRVSQRGSPSIDSICIHGCVGRPAEILEDKW